MQQLWQSKRVRSQRPLQKLRKEGSVVLVIFRDFKKEAGILKEFRCSIEGLSELDACLAWLDRFTECVEPKTEKQLITKTGKGLIDYSKFYTQFLVKNLFWTLGYTPNVKTFRKALKQRGHQFIRDKAPWSGNYDIVTTLEFVGSPEEKYVAGWHPGADLA